MKAVVWFPVEPLLLDLRAYFDAQLRRDGNETGVEELVEIRSKEHAVRHLVYAAVRERPDMRRFEDREGALARDRTTTLVRVRDHHPESTLPQTRMYQGGFTVTCLRFMDHARQGADEGIFQPFLNRRPQVCAFFLLGVVVTASNDVPGPTNGVSDLALLRPKERSGQHGASDLGVPCSRIGGKSLDHRFERFTRFRTVLPFEYLPGKRQG